MLPPRNRLKLPTFWSRSKPDFQLKTDLFKIIGRRVAEPTPVKIGFIINGKVGKANVRNRLRRLLAGFFYQQLEKIPGSQELIIIVHPVMAQASNEEIYFNLNKSLSKIYFR